MIPTLCSVSVTIKYHALHKALPFLQMEDLGLLVVIQASCNYQNSFSFIIETVRHFVCFLSELTGS